MFNNGLIKEAVKLKDYLGDNHKLAQTMGYKEAILLAENKITKEKAIENCLISHRQYAKRQTTWFKKESWWNKLII